MTLTQAQVKAYLENSSSCPFCGESDIEGSSVEIDSGGAWQNIDCNNCGAKWQDVYTLTDIIVTHEPHGEQYGSGV
jgi:transcription elongation factor Elf1